MASDSSHTNRIPDPIAQGLARGWRVLGTADKPLPPTLRCDVAIVGSGAGGGITAELLTAAGLDVVVIEEGPLRSSRDFQQSEAQAYPQLYQESAARKTADKAIAILQGRCVGGSTTVNWTSSFRTPSATLAYWRDHFQLPDMDDQALGPWFQQVEQRLNISPWLVAPNVNNQLLRDGAARLGIPAAAILRNVKGCWNLGSCGMGCPTNAKQSMLVTCLPVALDRGARLLVHSRVQRLIWSAQSVQGVEVQPVALNGQALAHPPTTVLARHVVVAGGAINSPALLLRSGVPDPHNLLGRRTFLHPVVVSAGAFDMPVQGWMGAPQTIYTDHFLETQPIDGPMGYKLEAPPLHPLIVGSTLPGHGAQQAALLRNLPNTHAVLALMRDGFHAESPGGEVRLRSDGSPELHYRLNDYFFEAARRALLSMAEIQFAAGAREVLPVHEMASPCTSWAQAQAMIQALPLKPLLTRVLSAHVMGGCTMAGDERRGVVRPDGEHWQLPGLSVHDGSVFPTSIGANPQLSVYAVATKFATQLAQRLAGRQVRLGA